MDGKLRPAHVVALEHVTPRPTGKVCSVKGEWVDGSKLDAAHGPCHDRLCCNPLHSSWKTRAENHTDKKRDGTHSANEDHHSSKLSDVVVDRIRELYKGRGKGPTQSELADQFGCDQAHISLIVNGKCRVAQ